MLCWALWLPVAQVVLVEEAAEVMETQILASLAPSVEHAIFIGDHEQLRPKANLWEMQASEFPQRRTASPHLLGARSRTVCIHACATVMCSQCSAVQCSAAAWHDVSLYMAQQANLFMLAL